jgi:TolA-binding protein
VVVFHIAGVKIRLPTPATDGTSTTDAAEPDDNDSVSIYRPPTRPAPTAPDADKVAAFRLEGARKYVEANRWDRARGVLEQIIEHYPDTAAAAEARELLKQVEAAGW